MPYEPGCKYAPDSEVLSGPTGSLCREKVRPNGRHGQLCAERRRVGVLVRDLEHMRLHGTIQHGK
jgi:hypothetical protein